MQYCVAANYYWLLVEGMYLYTLLVLSVFSEQRIFRLYLCIGWGKSVSCFLSHIIYRLLSAFACTVTVVTTLSHALGQVK